jgi:hypothetical protein
MLCIVYCLRQMVLWFGQFSVDARLNHDRCHGVYTSEFTNIKSTYRV